MIRLLSSLIAMGILIVLLTACFGFAGGSGPGPQSIRPPELDYTLMGFKEQGAWYFPCSAPEFPQRIPPHYSSYGPPPPPCCAPPCAPVGPPPVIRK